MVMVTSTSELAGLFIALVVGIAWMPLLGLGATALGSLFNRKKGAQQTQTGTQTGNTSSTSVMGPTVLDPQYQSLQNAIMPSIMRRIQSPTGLPRGYEESGIRKLNRTFDMARQGMDNRMTANGLGRSPVAAAGGNALDRARVGSIADFQMDLPMVARDMQNQDLGLAMQQMEFGRSLAGRTTTNTGTTSGTSTEKRDDGSGGGFLGNMSSMLGWLIGQGAFNKKAGGTPTGVGFSGGAMG